MLSTPTSRVWLPCTRRNQVPTESSRKTTTLRMVSKQGVPIKRTVLAPQAGLQAGGVLDEQKYDQHTAFLVYRTLHSPLGPATMASKSGLGKSPSISMSYSRRSTERIVLTCDESRVERRDRARITAGNREALRLSFSCRRRRREKTRPPGIKIVDYVFLFRNQNERTVLEILTTHFNSICTPGRRQTAGPCTGAYRHRSPRRRRVACVPDAQARSGRDRTVVCCCCYRWRSKKRGGSCQYSSDTTEHVIDARRETKRCGAFKHAST